MVRINGVKTEWLLKFETNLSDLNCLPLSVKKRDLKHQDGRVGRRRLADGEDWVYVPVVSMSCLLLSNWTLGREMRGKLK